MEGREKERNEEEKDLTQFLADTKEGKFTTKENVSVRCVRMTQQRQPVYDAESIYLYSVR